MGTGGRARGDRVGREGSSGGEWRPGGGQWKDWRALTNTDDGETLVDEDRVLCGLASGPVGSAVTETLGEGNGAGAEGRKVLLAVAAVTSNRVSNGAVEDQREWALAYA